MGWLTANEPEGQWPPSWYRATQAEPPARPPLAGPLRCETAIIGGGYTGLSAALRLAEAGRSVTVLEAVRCGFGASGRNGGQIGSGFNWSLERLSAALGQSAALSLWRDAAAGQALVRALIAAHAPEADYRPGVVHAVRSDAAKLRASLDAMRDKTGADLSWLDAEAMAARIGSRAYAGGVLDGDAGWCQPLAYAEGLARAAKAAGATIHEGTRVRRLVPGRPHRLATAAGDVLADRVIVAVNGYVDGLHGGLADRVLPINNYIATTEPLGARAPMADRVAVNDDRFVVNYWWQSRDDRLVYGGGESYGRRFPRDIAAKVRRNLARVYPELAHVRLTHAWGGTLAVTASRLPYVAELAPGLFAAGGYSGHGVALATWCGRAIADRITGDGAAFARLAALPVPRLPGGRWLGPAIAGAGLFGLSFRDRLGL